MVQQNSATRQSYSPTGRRDLLGQPAGDCSGETLISDCAFRCQCDDDVCDGVLSGRLCDSVLADEKIDA